MNWDERAVIAKQWNSDCEARFLKELTHSASQTKEYRGELIFEHRDGTTITLVEEDVVSAIFNHAQGKTCALNFASYKNPGGRFIDGAIAQEEALCHASFLYNVLVRHAAYYATNRQDLNHGLYRDVALYSPDIMFLKDGKTILTDVMTCAAPNWRAAQRNSITFIENATALNRRCKYVMSIAQRERVDTLILGAWGCGVFRQPPSYVAYYLIRHALLSGIRNVIFAIPSRDKNYLAFQEALSRANAQLS